MLYKDYLKNIKKKHIITGIAVIAVLTAGIIGFAGSKHAGKASGYSFIGIDVGGLRRILGDEIDDETAYLLSFIDYIQASNTSLTEQNITVTFNGKKNPLETAVDIFGDALNEM